MEILYAHTSVAGTIHLAAASVLAWVVCGAVISNRSKCRRNGIKGRCGGGGQICGRRVNV